MARRQWVSDDDFSDLLALAQMLPGPASSQTAFAIGLLKGGWLGGLAAWLGFTLPSAVLLFAYGYEQYRLGGSLGLAITHGLQLVAVAVVAQAVLQMQRSLAPDRTRASIALLGAVATLFCPAPFNTLIALVAGAMAGRLLLAKLSSAERAEPLPTNWQSPRIAYAALIVFVCGFACTFAIGVWVGRPGALFAVFYQTGALVFGGGHVVLPLLQSEVVGRGWMSLPVFLAGYGAAQAVPGPLFAIAAFIGAVAGRPWGALIALLAIFLPGLLLMGGLLPFWTRLFRYRPLQASLKGINAAVVGLLAAALYTPIWTSTVKGASDFAIALIAFVLLVSWKVAPWKVVLLTAGISAVAAAAVA